MSDWKTPIHPGEILADELKEIGMTALELGKRLGVPNNRLRDRQQLPGKLLTPFRPGRFKAI